MYFFTCMTIRLESYINKPNAKQWSKCMWEEVLLFLVPLQIKNLWHIFSSPEPKTQVSYCQSMLSDHRQPSDVNFSHFQLFSFFFQLFQYFFRNTWWILMKLRTKKVQKSYFIMKSSSYSPGNQYWYNLNGIISRACINKSPKGHWSLTWVQWALLLKVRFLSKSESTTAIFLKSVRTATIAIFQFRIRGCIRFNLLLLHSDLKKKSFGEGTPHWPIFGKLPPPPLDPPLGGVCR